MNTADPALDTRIAAFAAAVRAHLDDLDPEDVDDLTGGLEADLQEEAADHDGVLRLDDPVRYADELRTSAGLPERAVEAAPTSTLAQLRQGVRDRGDALLARIRARRELSATLDLLIAFRPVWWLLRAWAAYQCILVVLAVFFSVHSGSLLMPRGPRGWLLLVPLVAISVQWGRGRWAPTRWLRHLRAAVSVVTALALVVLIPLAAHDAGETRYVAPSSSNTSYVPQGLTLGGKRIGNVFAYDAEGNLLDRVQLFDQDGEPLTVVPPAFAEQDPVTGEQALPSSGAWNAFPLSPLDAGRTNGLTAEQIGKGRPTARRNPTQRRALPPGAPREHSSTISVPYRTATGRRPGA
ncbi:hypothetical protein [Clavibacter sp. CFBP 8614]|uniref:hypothetical protein n=1 Tax=unclassified Clavibacter TaxID=2626594 RepID=UPI0040416967